MTQIQTTNLASLLLRVGLATVWLAHATLKIFVFTVPGFAQWLVEHQLPGFMALPVIMMESIAGLTILSGFYGRYVSAFMIPVLSVALWTSLPNGWMHANPGGGWEYAAFLMVASAVHALLGDGAFALKQSALSRFTVMAVCLMMAGMLLCQSGNALAATSRVEHPYDMNQAFADAYNAGNIEQVMALYTSDAQLVNEDQTVASGLTEIRKVQTELLKIGGHFTSKNIVSVVAGDIALLNARWHISTKDKEGRSVELSGMTSEIVKRQPDGNWLYLVDNPFPPVK